ncbi:Mediator complex subunit Med4 protein [Dioscorea alata]|uniref:Mediator complex subunit Med4 protein n=1 Tax=Dioscorea alata TaxID=55571 RepID=A0ACB7V5X0_DIOAL|nr:Mediator complex subunit Med4 protein [Dioscorea alata]
MLQSHAPAIHPSPARLGLSNSPSTANAAATTTTTTTTKPPQSSSSSALPSPPPTSPSLLPLLPPLPRAQSLLLLMSSLASRLFEVSPHRSLWLSSFRGSIPSFLPSSPSPPLSLPSPPSSSKEILSLFTSLQTQLFEAVAELQEILDLQDSRVKLTRDIRSKDSTLLSFTNKIKEAEQLLDHLLDDYSDYRPNPKRPRSDHLDLNDVLSYAHRISYTTFAPPEHGAGLPQLRGSLPPAPQENELRASMLYHFADLDVGVPAGKVESKEGVTAGDDSGSLALIEPTPPREQVPTVPIPTPMLPIAVPPGWKKGMPVELPSELPPVPPGWKPGDPVPLPPLDGLLVGDRVEEPRIPAGLPVPPLKAPEAIQVKYVELDINPGQDDYSSDYSSEVGSSDEDDEE